MKKIIFLSMVLVLGSSCIPLAKEAADKAASFTEKKSDSGSSSGSNDRTVASTPVDDKASFDALEVQQQTRLSEREYVFNVFVDVFGPSGDVLNSVTRNLIFFQGVVFNGACSNYEAQYVDNASVALNGTFIIDDVKNNCSATTINNMMIGTEGSVREGYRVQACENAVKNDTQLLYLLNTVTGGSYVVANFPSAVPAVSDDYIKKIYARFYPARPIPDEIFTSLKGLITAIDAQPTILVPAVVGPPAVAAVYSDKTIKAKWRTVALAVCLSTDWQTP